MFNMIELTFHLFFFICSVSYFNKLTLKVVTFLGLHFAKNVRGYGPMW